MIQLSEQNVLEYLRAHHRLAPHDGTTAAREVLVQSLSGGIANVVLKILDLDGGPKVGSDLRTPAQIKNNAPDPRPNASLCFVLKQPLPKFKTAAEWLVDIDRVLLERDCMNLLAHLLPAGSLPTVLWFDEPNHILAMSAAPAGALLWKKSLLEGHTSSDAAIHAAMLLAMLHSSTTHDAPLLARYGNPKLFIQQRIDPYFQTIASAHPDVASQIHKIMNLLLSSQLCLIHGDFSPKNILLIPAEDPAKKITHPTHSSLPNTCQSIVLLDFEVAFYGHPAFDVATLINHLLLKAFHHGRPWRNFMLLIDAFWQTYLHTADRSLTSLIQRDAGHLLAALLLARIDGKSPAEYLTDPAIQQTIRSAAKSILTNPDSSLDHALDALTLHFPP